MPRGNHKNSRGPTRLPELLAPAGGPDAFRAALAGGADAIYCGVGNDFNARRSAGNFTLDEFRDACEMAHLAGTRVYVTLNVVIQQDEMEGALALAHDVWLAGADALIIQDWGLLAEVRRLWPQIECHVSTQANVHDARATTWCAERFGAERVTLSRELSLAEIKTIADTGVEVECFGHGAICYCYSGVCLLSSMVGGRSANRGQCAQPCRLPYDLVDAGGRSLVDGRDVRPLCPRDYNLVGHLERLAQAGVGSLKVEGRMKAPDYVFSVVGAYREALDALALDLRPADEARGVSGEGAAAGRGSFSERVRPDVDRRLKRAFNRDFTDAYLMGRSGNEMMSYGRSNNRGELVGEVVGSVRLPDSKARRGGANGGRERGRTQTRAEVRVRLFEPVGSGDLLEIRPVGDPSQFLTGLAKDDAAAGETITLTCARPMEPGCPVRVIRSQKALDATARATSPGIVRKRFVNARVTALPGKPFTVELRTVDGRFSAVAEGDPMEPARTRELTEADVIEHVGRMGGTPFACNEVEVRLGDGLGMSFSAIHAVRARATDALCEKILAEYACRGEKTLLPDGWSGDRLGKPPAARPVAGDAATPPGSLAAKVELCAVVTTPEAARAALDAGADTIYANVDDLAAGEWPEGVVAVLDEVCREVDHDRLDRWVSPGARVAAGNVSELVLAAGRGATCEVRGCIPVHNMACARELAEAGAERIWLSPELTLAQVRTLARGSDVPMGLVVYGRARVMTAEHCVLQVANRCVGDCASCGLRESEVILRSIDGDLFPVRTDLQGRTRIYDARPLDAMPQVPDLIAAGVKALAVDATLLDAEEAARQVARLAKAIRASEGGTRPPAREDGATTGHLFSGIG